MPTQPSPPSPSPPAEGQLVMPTPPSTPPLEAPPRPQLPAPQQTGETARDPRARCVPLFTLLSEVSLPTPRVRSESDTDSTQGVCGVERPVIPLSDLPTLVARQHAPHDGSPLEARNCEHDWVSASCGRFLCTAIRCAVPGCGRFSGCRCAMRRSSGASSDTPETATAATAAATAAAAAAVAALSPLPPHPASSSSPPLQPPAPPPLPDPTDAAGPTETSPSPGRSPRPCTNSLGHFWTTSLDHCGMDGCQASFCEVPECLLVWPCACTRGYGYSSTLPADLPPAALAEGRRRRVDGASAGLSTHAVRRLRPRLTRRTCCRYPPASGNLPAIHCWQPPTQLALRVFSYPPRGCSSPIPTISRPHRREQPRRWRLRRALH